MPTTLKVKSNDEDIKRERELTAKRVLNYFDGLLPPSRLLCFLDDQDPLILRRHFGPANRGFYGPIHDGRSLGDLPDYVADCICIDDGHSIPFPLVIDDLVYLYGTTCANEVGLAMTLAHELQHAIQHGGVRKLWAVNSLVRNLDQSLIDALKLQWADIPTEREARIVSKRAAIELFGDGLVADYIGARITEAAARGDSADASDWQFVSTLTPLSSVDLDSGTHQLFGRLRNHRSQFESLVREREFDLDYRDIDLAVYFDR